MLSTKFRFLWQSSFREEFLEINHLAKQFQRRVFRNQPIRNKNCLWWPCLWMDRDEMSNLYREPSIYASYQLLVHLAMQFQKRRFFFKSTNQKQELPVAAMFGTKWTFFIENLTYMPPTKFQFIWLRGFRGED